MANKKELEQSKKRLLLDFLLFNSHAVDRVDNI